MALARRELSSADGLGESEVTEWRPTRTFSWSAGLIVDSRDKKEVKMASE